jgi:hypothetical protein
MGERSAMMGDVKKSRLGLIVGPGAALLLLVGGMVSFHGLRERRESELMERLSGLEAIIGKSTNWVEQARAEKLVTVDDLPILVRWLGRGYRSGWLEKLEAAYRRFDPDYGSVDGGLEFKATRGFAILGTNAARAIPAFVGFLRQGNDPDIAIQALGSIGEPVWETAMEFTKSDSAADRMFGAYLLGLLRMRPDESVPILMRLKDDEESGIRASALVALAEFPCEETLALFSEMLRSENRALIDDGAYGLHQGGKEAMRILVDRFEGTTNRWIQQKILRAAFAREGEWRANKFGMPRSWAYQWKHGYLYSASHNEVTFWREGSGEVELMNTVREKLLNDEGTDLVGEMERIRRGSGSSPE